MWLPIVGGIVVFGSILLWWRRTLVHATTKDKAVLISGCDTGMGESTALALDKLGFKVYAGCLKSESVVSLSERSSSNLVAFKLDVTSEADINNAVQIVTASSPEGLWALINNAGIPSAAPIEWLTLGYYKRAMEVNFFGSVVAMTSAFLPLLKKTRGRVVNMSSVCGFLAIPGSAAYTASKHAIEGYSDTLRREIGMWGVSVIMIEPGVINTPILELHSRGVANAWGALSPAMREQYGEEFYNKVQDQSLNRTLGIPPQVVADRMVHAVRARYPAPRYRVGKGMPLIVALSYLPTGLLDSIFNLLQPVPQVLSKRK